MCAEFMFVLICRCNVQGALMEYLLFLMNQHKVEVTEVMSSDPILKAELEYDLKNYEKSKEKQRLMKEQANMMQLQGLHIRTNVYTAFMLSGCCRT
jgi:hypothetical protein